MLINHQCWSTLGFEAVLWSDDAVTTIKTWNLTRSPLLLTSTGGTSPSCRWSSATCWLSWRRSSPMVCFKVTTSASPRQMLQSSGGAPSGTSESNYILLFTLNIILFQWFHTGILEPYGVPYRLFPKKINWIHCLIRKTINVSFLTCKCANYNRILDHHTHLISPRVCTAKLDYNWTHWKNKPAMWNCKTILIAGFSQYHIYFPYISDNYVVYICYRNWPKIWPSYGTVLYFANVGLSALKVIW